MTKNRRFPFERTNEEILLENFSTTEQQLYSIIRQYASICRYNNTNEQPRYLQQNIISNQDNYRLNQLINHLKQDRNKNFVDINDFSGLRQHNLQRWKHVKYEWQNYYREEIKKQQELFDNVIKCSRNR